MQPFPSAGEQLHANLDLRLPTLRSRVSGVPGCAYSYVVTSVEAGGAGAEHELVSCGVRGGGSSRCSRPRRTGGTSGQSQVVFEQWGSAPNFQGDIITLCTCKHQMRAGMEADDWCGTWVAGFTSRVVHDGRNWLFYLARVQQGLASHHELWNYLDADVREVKSAGCSIFGDVYTPRGGWDGTRPHSPANYESPVAGHVHENIWHGDINSRYYGRRPALLAFDPDLSFLWRRPLIYLDWQHSRANPCWDDLPQLLAELRGV